MGELRGFLHRRKNNIFFDSSIHTTSS